MIQDKGNPGVAAAANAGDTFTIVYPFIREMYEGPDEEGWSVRETWRPGTRSEDVGPEDAAEFADGIGSVAFTVVGVYRPGRFPTRVFFTRKFTDPDGRTFGKDKLHIKTLGQFRRLTSGYLEPYGMDGIPAPNRYRWSLAEARAEFERLLAEHAAAS